MHGSLLDEWTQLGAQGLVGHEDERYAEQGEFRHSDVRSWLPGLPPASARVIEVDAQGQVGEQGLDIQRPHRKHRSLRILSR